MWGLFAGWSLGYGSGNSREAADDFSRVVLPDLRFETDKCLQYNVALICTSFISFISELPTLMQP